MSRLIDADAYHASLQESYQKAIEWKKESELKKLTNHESMATQAAMTFMECILRLKEQPTVDAVEVVRCRDCKHNAYCCRSVNPYGRCDNDYCSYGVRKDGDHHDNNH